MQTLQTLNTAQVLILILTLLVLGAVGVFVLSARVLRELVRAQDEVKTGGVQ